MQQLTCDYYEGMFAGGQMSEAGALDAINNVATHEAAHAVISFGLGLTGCGEIEIRDLVEEGRISGEARHSAKTTAAILEGLQTAARDRRGRISPVPDMLLHDSIIACAGPAAERRYALERGRNPVVHGGSASDHIAVDGVAKRLATSGRDRFAYRRLAWHCAQRLIANDTVWKAIEHVADVLASDPHGPDDGEDDGSIDIYTMNVIQFERLMKTLGIKQGSFVQLLRLQRHQLAA